MQGPISKCLRTTFLVHMIVAALLGIALWLVPGRTLALLGWVPEWVPISNIPEIAKLPAAKRSIPGQTFVDPVLTRIIGAALLALAFSSYRGWRSASKDEVSVLVQMEAVFCVLGVIAFLYGAWAMSQAVEPRAMPPIGWALAVVLAGFAVSWAIALRR
ncbi:MAG: hypothetical protein HXY20_05950 [Acidobacteria bacterium]|nr:hypothetical protein [Acidobacteriota bacterium]